MHIHSGYMNSSLGGTHAASSALAARRAEETRKKLLATSSELDATASTEGAWMVTAWAGGNGASTPDRSSQNQSSQGQSEASTSEAREGEEIQRTPPAAAISYWA